MSDIRRFCDDLTERARTALSVGAVDRYLHLGGAVVSLRCAGDDLAAIFEPALAHACGPAAATGDNDLEIWAWDRKATGIAPPPPAWPLEDHLPTGAVRGLTDGPVRVNFDRWQRVLTVYDVEQRRVIIAAADASEIPEWVLRSPLRPVLTSWAAERGWAMIHGGTVATEYGAVVLAGASGSGKSTTTLTAMAAGLGFMGDDACLVTFDPEPVAHAVYGRAKLEPDALALLPELRHLVIGTDAGAPVLDPADSLVRSAPLRTVALVSIGSTDATIVSPLPSSVALRQLVESSLDEGGATTLSGLRRLVVDVPCVALSLGRDRAGVVDVVRRLGGGEFNG